MKQVLGAMISAYFEHLMGLCGMVERVESTRIGILYSSTLFTVAANTAVTDGGTTLPLAEIL